ncbi:MAG: TraR/DksA family transcriptional regulator [Thermodesulfobacteriota bacterium]
MAAKTVKKKKTAPVKKTVKTPAAKPSKKAAAKKTAVKKTAKAAPPKKTPAKKSSAPKKTSASPAGSKYGKRFLDEISKELLLMKDRLVKDVARSVKQESDHLKFDVGDFYDKASDDRERILSLIFSERERNKLDQIEDALGRIEEGTYGICEMTGEKIGEDRLRVMPFAKFTIEAQEEIEKVG